MLKTIFHERPDFSPANKSACKINKIMQITIILETV